jgi:nitrite reductase/ring-hydroxylating ferredoxin subunit
VSDWVDVGGSHQVPESGGFEVVIQGQIVAIFRHQGVLFALEGMCAHQGGPLARGSVGEGCVTCPWHGWRYRLDSGCNAITGQPMLSTWEIREVDQRVYLRDHSQTQAG